MLLTLGVTATIVIAVTMTVSVRVKREPSPSPFQVATQKPGLVIRPWTLLYYTPASTYSEHTHRRQIGFSATCRALAERNRLAGRSHSRQRRAREIADRRVKEARPHIAVDLHHRRDPRRVAARRDLRRQSEMRAKVTHDAPQLFRRLQNEAVRRILRDQRLRSRRPVPRSSGATASAAPPASHRAVERRRGQIGRQKRYRAQPDARAPSAPCRAGARVLCLHRAARRDGKLRRLRDAARARLRPAARRRRARAGSRRGSSGGPSSETITSSTPRDNRRGVPLEQQAAC